MSPRLRFLVAGFLALVAIGAFGVYAAWPMWRGTEVYMPVTTRAQGDGRVWLDLPDERLDPAFPGVTRTAAPGEAVFVPIRAIGNLWNTTADVESNASLLRGRTLFVQIQPAGSRIAGGWTAWRPVSVSDGPIAGEVNLRAHVQNVDSSGRLQVRYAVQSVRRSPELADSRQTVDWRKAPVGRGGATREIEPITSAYAILRVLPSGRCAVVGTIVMGKRIPG